MLFMLIVFIERGNVNASCLAADCCRVFILKHGSVIRFKIDCSPDLPKSRSVVAVVLSTSRRLVKRVTTRHFMCLQTVALFYYCR